MLKKCLKYDIKHIWNTWWVISASQLGISMLAGATIFFMIRAINYSEWVISALLNLILILVTIGCIILIAILPVASSIVVYARYYKNFFTDEAYLTFTLPVSRKTHFHSKIICAFIYLVGSFLVSGASVLAILSISSIADPTIITASLNIFSAFLGIFDVLGGVWIPLLSVEGIVFLFVSAISQILLIYLSLSVGSAITQKHKLIVGIGVYYLSSLAVQLINNILVYTFLPSGIDHQLSSGAMIGIYLLIMIVIHTVLAIVCYKTTLSILEKKLNLA